MPNSPVSPPATPMPSNKRTADDAALESGADPNFATPPPGGRQLSQPTTPAADAEEPPCGAAVGVHAIHPMQHTFPLAFKTTSELKEPWTGSPYKCPRITDASYPPFIIFVIDMSPSMACTPNDPSGEDRTGCAAHAVHEMLGNLKASLTELSEKRPQVCIAGFAGSCGFEPSEYLDYKYSKRGLVARQHLNLETIQKNSALLDDAERFDALISKWQTRVKSVYDPDTEDQRHNGAGTNMEDALHFATRVGDIVCNSEGLYSQVDTHVVLMTDGRVTLGIRKASELQNKLKTHIEHKEFFAAFQPEGKSPWYCDQPQWAAPTQFHTLMMGNDPDPCFLTNVMDGNGILAYAKDPSEIAPGVETILRPLLENKKGRMQIAVATCFVDDDDTMLSDWTVTSHDGGALLNDNFTCLFEARVPATFRQSGGSCPTREELCKMFVRTVVFANPFLFDMLKTVDFDWKENGTSTSVVALLAQQHEILFDERVRMSSSGFFTTCKWDDGRNVLDVDYHDSSRMRVMYATKTLEVAHGIYGWVKEKHILGREISETLVREARDLVSTQDSVARWEQAASNRGQHSTAKRLRAMRESTASASARGVDSDARFSAQHWAMSQYSQTPSGA